VQHPFQLIGHSEPRDAFLKTNGFDACIDARSGQHREVALSFDRLEREPGRKTEFVMITKLYRCRLSRSAASSGLADNVRRLVGR
jgi:hypothetical protein